MDKTGIDVILSDDAKNGLGQNPSINEVETNFQQQEDLKTKELRRRSLRNLLVFNTCYVLVYTGFWSLANLQSTMNAASNIGDYTQAAIYICSMVSSLLLPKVLIEKFGCKNVLVVGTIICCFSIGSNMILRWDLMMTASVAFGLINGPYASAQSFYIDEMATRFQSTISENMEFIMASFFGIFLFFALSTQIWGNVIAYYALMRKNPIDVNPNDTSECGADFLPSSNDSNTNLDLPTDEQRFILVGSYLAMGLLAVLIMVVFMDPLENDLKEGGGWRTSYERVVSSFKHLLKPHQFLLIPLTIYIGMEAPFYGNEFSQAYIACSWGVHHVGFVTVCFGVCGAIMSLLVGPLVKCVSQMAVLILAALANVSICIVLFLWEPTPEFKTMYFVIAGVWGMGDAIWWSQVTALYGLMFPNDREAAFSNLYFWSFLGFFLSYSYANYFTVAVKINILLCFLLAGMLGYMIGQIRLKCSTRKEYVAIPDGEDSS